MSLSCPSGLIAAPSFSVVIMSCVVGGYFATHLPVAIFPQLLVPRILVAADAGDIPIDMTLVSVTRPLEAAVSTVPGVSRVSSATTRGSADLDVTFDWGTNMQAARRSGSKARSPTSVPRCRKTPTSPPPWSTRPSFPSWATA